MKFFFSIAFFFSFILLSACQSTLKISFEDAKKNPQKSDSAAIDFETELGSIFQQTIQAILTNTQSGSTSNNIIFETDEIQKELLNAGFENATVQGTGIKKLSIKIISSKTNSATNKKDPAWASGILLKNESSEGLYLSKDSLKSIYKNLPEIFKSYLDLFGAPVFTGEQMDNKEYLEMIACVYGSDLADEIANAKVKISINDKTVNLPLIDLLNLQEPFIIKN